MSAASTTPVRSPVLWGAYLACSWTWCIGMFLPAVLMRDMGWPGFLIFALPNVIGAAAMGWILKTRVDSERFVEKHPTAVWWFSAVTLAFHLFWILWISNFIRGAFQLPGGYIFGAIGIAVAFSTVQGRALRAGRVPQLAVGLLALSLGVLLATFLMPDVKEANRVLWESAPKSNAPLWMLPVMLYGFLLCPYLDITFHHARQQLDTGRNGRLGFSLGFVGFFSFMILLTTRYAGVMAGALDGTSFVSIASPWLAAGILTHILCQWVFTVRAHLGLIRTIPDEKPKRALGLGVAVLSGLVGFLAMHIPAYAGLTGGELVYRGFMAAYGLVFPTYMLYRAVVAYRRQQPIALPVMWGAMALASPMFWLGFMERAPIWLVPGMAVVLLGTLPLFTKDTK